MRCNITVSRLPSAVQSVVSVRYNAKTAEVQAQWQVLRAPGLLSAAECDAIVAHVSGLPSAAAASASASGAAPARLQLQWVREKAVEMVDTGELQAMRHAVEMIQCP